MKTEITNAIVRVLVNRDNMTLDEANKQLSEARQAVEDVQDPEEILLNYFGLEPDYIFDLLGRSNNETNKNEQ